MEHYLFRHDDWERWYNCSRVDVDSVPLERRQGHLIATIVTIVLTTVYTFLYFPCMHSLWKHQKEGNACYRLLFYAGIMDIYLLFSLGFMHSYFALIGAVYCTHPKLLYFHGVVQDFFFSIETLSNLILALNRCLDILAPEIGRTLFEGARIWYWLVGMTLYGFYWFWFVNPALFNGIYFAYFFNPFQGYIEDAKDEYHPLTHTLHDWIVGYGLPVVYIGFLIGLKLKMRGAIGGLGLTKLQIMSFLQVLVLSILHIFGGFIYVFIQMVPVGASLIVLSQFTWFHIHGLPPIIFLVMNRTVRSDCIILFHRIFTPNRVRRMHGVTVLDPKSGLPLSTTTQNSVNTQNTAQVGVLPPVRGQVRAQQEKF